MMPLEQLDVSADLLRHAVPRLAQSPLYGLVAAHVVALFGAADALSVHPSAADVARSSVDLARALVTSLSTDGVTRREGVAQTLLVRVREYVRQNLRDPDLNAASIAHAHHISLRHLYSVCAAAEISLEQHIIRSRLRGVRAELSLPAAQRRSIESVAYGWGFRNVSHFTRRFSAEFGVSPREWRGVGATARERGLGTGSGTLIGAGPRVGANPLDARGPLFS
jgi:AraC-like DNA-binding protein